MAPGTLLIRSTTHGLKRFRALSQDKNVRTLLLWCMPALIVGFILRAALTLEMPYGLYHDDTPDFLETPDKLLNQGNFDLHTKKTFLVPVLFTIPFLLKLPALIVIPAAQHLLGLALVVLMGLLCRLWFRHWKFFILPITLLTASNPYLLWYEHTLMAETTFVFCTVLVAVAGTLYARAQTLNRFVFLGCSLVLEAAARPEGKLLFAFGIFLLLLLHFREFRTTWRRLAIMMVIAVLTHLSTKTSQAGLLLYTSVVRLTPENVRVAPGFNGYIAPLQTDLQNRWETYPNFPRVRDRRVVSDTVDRYIADQATQKKKAERVGVNDLCLKLAMETCIRNITYLPFLAYHKFRYVATDAPCGRMDDRWLIERQRKTYIGTLARTERLSKGLTGKQLSSEEEIIRFIDEHYRQVQWFDTFLDQWQLSVNRHHLPDRIYKDESAWDGKFVYPGIPLYFLIGGAGLVIICLRKDRNQWFHIAWGVTLIGFFFVVMLTANVRPRFRIVFEPFWFIYIGVLMDISTTWLTGRFSRHSVQEHRTNTNSTPEHSEAPLV